MISFINFNISWNVSRKKISRDFKTPVKTIRLTVLSVRLALRRRIASASAWLDVTTKWDAKNFSASTNTAAVNYSKTVLASRRGTSWSNCWDDVGTSGMIERKRRVPRIEISSCAPKYAKPVVGTYKSARNIRENAFFSGGMRRNRHSNENHDAFKRHVKYDLRCSRRNRVFLSLELNTGLRVF